MGAETENLNVLLKILGSFLVWHKYQNCGTLEKFLIKKGQRREPHQSRVAWIFQFHTDRIWLEVTM